MASIFSSAVISFDAYSLLFDGPAFSVPHLGLFDECLYRYEN